MPGAAEKLDANFDSRDLDLLVPDFAALVKEVIQRCQARKVVMVPFFTLRGPGVQAKLWCRSRTVADIEAEQRIMRKAGAPWLASLLNVKFGTDHPERDPKLPLTQATKATPGLSWHQWGKAVDCFVKAANGAEIWDPDHFGYQIYAEEAARMGLTAGLHWKSFPDAVHVQLTSSTSPVKDGILWPAIEKQMLSKFRS